MKTRFLTVAAAALLACSSASGLAAETNAAAAVELKALVVKIRAKLQVVNHGKPTEVDLAPELKEFDDLLAKYKDDKSDDVAQILVMKATLYSEVFANETKSEAVLAQLKRDFPDSKTVVILKRQEEGKKLRANLIKGAAFPDFNEKDLAGNPLSIAGFKGKVVLIEFWATWCAPCIIEVPGLLKAYNEYHAKGFEIIGICLDEDRQSVESFIKRRQMPWPQFFDGKVFENKLAQQYGVQGIPTSYLLDGDGKIIGSNLRGEALEAAVAEAMARK